MPLVIGEAVVVSPGIQGVVLPEMILILLNVLSNCTYVNKYSQSRHFIFRLPIASLTFSNTAA
jgi:hypothetical protein